MQSHQKIITVGQEDLDHMNHVNNVRYLQWVQDIAEEHWKLLATQEMLNNFVWVVLSHHIEYRSAALLNDKINIKTYVANSEGVVSTRHVEMYHADTGKLLVKAQTQWCLLNAGSKKPIRIPTELKNIFE